jgi:hypothetical protein
MGLFRMSDALQKSIEQTAQKPFARVAFLTLAAQLEELNKLHENAGTRDNAVLLAKGWAETGGDLRKAAVREWAKDRKIDLGDKPDPNATPPKPGQLSDGIDAPDSGKGAAGQKKTGQGWAQKIRALRMGAAGAGGAHVDPVTAAYEQGHRDATAKHSGHAHRVGRIVSRHAFAMGAQVGAAGVHHEQSRTAGSAHMPIPTQANVSQMPVMKGFFGEDLEKGSYVDDRDSGIFHASTAGMDTSGHIQHGRFKPPNARASLKMAITSLRDGGRGVAMKELASKKGKRMWDRANFQGHIDSSHMSVMNQASISKGYFGEDLEKTYAGMEARGSLQAAGRARMRANAIKRGAISAPAAPTSHFGSMKSLAFRAAKGVARGIGRRPGLYAAGAGLAASGALFGAHSSSSQANVSKGYFGEDLAKDQKNGPSYIQATGRSIAESLPGGALAGFGVATGHPRAVIAGALGASAGMLHGAFASYRNQARKQGYKRPGISALRAQVGGVGGALLGGSVGRAVGGKLGAAVGGLAGGVGGARLVGFGSKRSSVAKFDGRLTLAKLRG